MRTPKSRLAGARAAADPADADRAISRLYAANYRPLVRLAALLVPDLAIAETLVQDAFVDLHGTWPGQSGADVALAQLRRAIVERSRSVPPAVLGTAGETSSFVTALRGLPARQREALVLHYFADMTEAQIAAATGIGADAVRSHLALAFSLLRAELPAVA